jgi:hypothetical protein
MILRSESDSYRILPLSYGSRTLCLRAAVLVCGFLRSCRKLAATLRAIPRPAVRAASKCFHLHENGPKSHFGITEEEEECTRVPDISNKHSNIQGDAVRLATKRKGKTF